SDRILVFDQGRLAEQGPHDELMRLDGKYARLVKIQSQIARNSQLEAPLNSSANDLNTDRSQSQPPSDRDVDSVDFAPRWLEPDQAEIREGSYESLELVLPDGIVHRGVFAVRCFPATTPDEFISLRVWDRDGQEIELGIVRDLSRWSDRSRELLRA